VSGVHIDIGASLDTIENSIHKIHNETIPITSLKMKEDNMTPKGVTFSMQNIRHPKLHHSLF